MKIISLKVILLFAIHIMGELLIYSCTLKILTLMT